MAAPTPDIRLHPIFNFALAAASWADVQPARVQYETASTTNVGQRQQALRHLACVVIAVGGCYEV